MSLRVWRVMVAVAVALTACVAGYEALAPRIEFFDGATTPVGAWFAIPGQPTARYRVNSVESGGNLAAAGIAPGDVIVPDDAFAARWLLRPGDVVPLHVERGGSSRAATVVASHRIQRTAPVGWVVRAGRAILQFALFALALVIAWQLPDERWVRSLTVFLVAAGFGPWQVDPLEYVGFVRPIAFVLEGWGTQVAICAAVVFAASVPDPPKDGFRRAMIRTLFVALPLQLTAIVGMLFDLRLVYVTPPLRVLQAVLIVATVVMLALAAERASGQDRQRLRYLAWTIGLAFSGFFVSVVALWFVGNAWGDKYQEWSLARLTLLIVPIGFAYGLLAHRVVSSTFIASRTLVYGALTSLLVPVFAAAEWGATSLFVSNQGKSALFVGLTVIVTASFKTVHKKVDTLVDQWIFKKRHADEKAIDKFTKEVPHIHDAATLSDRCMQVLDEHVGAKASALYVHAEPETMTDLNAEANYLRVSAAGDDAPESIGELDPVVLSLKAELDAVESDALGKGGHAFPMTMRGHLMGFVAIGPKRDGEILSPKEITRLTGMANAVAVAFEAIRINDLENRLASAEAGRAELKRLLTDLVRPSDNAGPSTDAAS